MSKRMRRRLRYREGRKKRNSLFTICRKKVRERNSKLANLNEDGNCSFQAIAYELHGDESQYKKARGEALPEIIRSVEK